MESPRTGPRSQPPIGLLLRTLDRLITERFEATLGARGVTRRQWQLLNGLAEPATLDELNASVAPFLDGAAGETAAQHLEPLVESGAVSVDGDTYALTDAGRGLVESLAIEVEATRNLLVAGLAEGEYDRTVATLQAMIANLEDAASPSARRDRGSQPSS